MDTLPPGHPHGRGAATIWPKGRFYRIWRKGEFQDKTEITSVLINSKQEAPVSALVLTTKDTPNPASSETTNYNSYGVLYTEPTPSFDTVPLDPERKTASLCQSDSDPLDKSGLLGSYWYDLTQQSFLTI